MARWGAILLVALAVIVCGQLYAGDSERSTKKAACAEAKGVLTKSATRPATKDPDGAGDGDQRSEEQDQAGREKLLVEAAARCAADAVLPDRGRVAISTFLAAVGPFVGMLAFILAGLRYDAGMRGAFGGGSTCLEIEPAAGARGRRWIVRNVGLGPEMIVGVRISSWPSRGSSALCGTGFEMFNDARRVEIGKELPFDSTGLGDDLLVAVLSRGMDARQVATWTRFRAIDASGAYEKREDGRVLHV